MQVRPFGKTGESFPILSFGGQRIVDGHGCTEDEAIEELGEPVDVEEPEELAEAEPLEVAEIEEVGEAEPAEAELTELEPEALEELEPEELVVEELEPEELEPEELEVEEAVSVSASDEVTPLGRPVEVEELSEDEYEDAEEIEELEMPYKTGFNMLIIIENEVHYYLTAEEGAYRYSYHFNMNGLNPR